MADRINSRKKGAKNERALTKLFEQWTGVEFARVPASGGLRWQGMESIIVGDIIPSGDIHFAIDFPFSLEAKAYAELDFVDPLLDNNSKIYDFWAQSTRDANRSKKLPLVFMRRNGMKKDVYLVEMSYDLFKALGINKSLYFLQFDEDFVIIRSDGLFGLDYIEVQQVAQNILKSKTWKK